VAVDGSVGVDFQLPRFAISLVAVRPAADTPEIGATGDGCSCDVKGRGGSAAGTVLLGICWLLLAGGRPPRRIA